MRRIIHGLAVWILGAACGSGVATAQEVRISEIHYDNTGTDSAEAIEISGPADTSLEGWQVVLYNGNGGVTYDTRALSGTIAASCDTRGVVVLNYATNGIQNGGSGATDTSSPDAVALVDASGTVVEFLSYEGVLAATDGPAVGLTSTDIGVREVGTEATGQSLWRDSAGTWSGPATSTFGTCNDNGQTEEPAEVASVSVSPSSATVTVGATQTFTASALSETSETVSGVSFTWSSSDSAVASVSTNGVATALSAGDTVITATAPNGISGTAALHVDTATSNTSDFRFSEIHYDNSGTDSGEAIEVEGPAGASVEGYSIVLYNGNGGASYNTTTLSGVIPATCATRGVIVVNYAQDGIQNGSPDGFALVDASGQLIEFLSYEGTMTATNGPAAGVLSTDIGVSQSSAAAGQSLQRSPSSNQWSAATSTFGACNSDTGTTPTGNTISFSGRLSSDPALPVGYQDQLFATVRDASNTTVTTTITWSSETPSIASIDQNGVMTALAEGTATVRATAADGTTTATYSLPTRVAVASTTAQYGNNTEFGEPTDSDASDDYIVHYSQYTASYNQNRGTPNWVSYDLDATHFGAEDRCDCFTMDPALPSTFTQLTTADYTNGGTYAGYSIDRGHFTRSYDRTSGSLDNAVTYLFTNIVPQAADLNQGPWATLENVLGDYASSQNKEVYIIAGVAGNKGTIKDEGKIVIPESTWKVAVIVERDQGLADIHSHTDLQVIAVNMPNEPGIRDVSWETYQTTVDAIEALSGYDLLSLLPDNIEAAIESNTQPPVANFTASPSSTSEGSSITVDASASADPDGTIESYAWNFGDGSAGSGAQATHTYTQDGVYTVTLTITDNNSVTDTITTTVTVTNVAPTVGDIGNASLIAGETYSLSGSFTDPGAEDSWTINVDWGDGSTATTTTVTDRAFALTHAYSAAGTYTVNVSVADDDTTTSVAHTVTVTAATAAVAEAKKLVDELMAKGKLGRATGALIKAELTAAERLLARSSTLWLAKVSLQAVISQINTLVRVNALSAADAAQLTSLLARIVSAL